MSTINPIIMNKILVSLLSIPYLFLTTLAEAQNRIVVVDGEVKAKDVPIDSLFKPGILWSYTDATLEAEWKDKGFKWNSASLKDHGIIRRENYGFGPLKISAFAGARNVEEVSFGFKSGKLSEVAIAIWNKGDSKDAALSEKDFTGFVDAWSAELNRTVAPKYEDRGRDTACPAPRASAPKTPASF